MFCADQYQLGKNGIAIKIKQNKKAIVAADGWYEKLTCLISAYFPCNGLKVNVSVMSEEIWCFLKDGKTLGEYNGGETVGMTVTVLFITMSAYYYLLLGII